NRKLPYAFTEQGVAMLSAVLRSETAVEVSIKIMDTFVEMRKFISKNAEVFMRLDNIEIKQIKFQSQTEKNFEKVFEAIEDKTLPNKGIFFEGQVFDAYKFVSELIKSAKESIILIDNYVDETVLTLFEKRNENVKVVIYSELTKQIELDLKKFNSQYERIEIKQFNKSHDRFLIIDNQVYHFGASLKDLGKKWFAFSKFDKEAVKVLEKLS
ncbi:MAG: ORF6N domain-containing protein, partial [DPANN group archaeon]|nr:ORF6N domain-containing protein [DPANN group archaeon]